MAQRLIATAFTMTRRQAEVTDSVLSFGNVKLDRSTYVLSTEHGEFRLANKEYQMMEMLMTNPRILISTDRFMEKIWGYDSDAEINGVWVYISYLRKKLTAIDASIAIKATRGAGYALEEKG